MIIWILIGSFIVIGFHFVLRIFGTGTGDLATSLHPIRRIQHFATGVLIVLLYEFVPHYAAIAMIITPSLIFFALDVIRRKFSPRLNQWFLSNWQWLLRPHELYDSPPAALFFLYGVSFVVLITSYKPVVFLSILFLSACDPAASVFGILIGGCKITSKKSLAGTTAAGVVGAIITEAVAWYCEIDLNILVGFIIAVISELITIKYLDDNFTIPVISCVLWTMWLRF